MDKKSSVWRFNLHTYNGEKKQEEVFDFCKEKGIIGTRLGI